MTIHWKAIKKHFTVVLFVFFFDFIVCYLKILIETILDSLSGMKGFNC